MSKTTSAKEMLFDFLSTAAIIGLSAFCFFYFIVADHWELAENITKAAASASIFSIFFITKLKFEKTKMIKFKEEASLDDVLVYFTDADKVKDLIAVISLPVLMGCVAWYDAKITAIDQWQMFITFFVAYAWHRFIFRKKEEIGNQMSATVYDKMKDQVFVFFLPMVTMAIPLLNRTFDTIDQIQIAQTFAIMYFWHKYLIRKND